MPGAAYKSMRQHAVASTCVPQRATARRASGQRSIRVQTQTLAGGIHAEYADNAQELCLHAPPLARHVAKCAGCAHTHPCASRRADNRRPGALTFAACRRADHRSHGAEANLVGEHTRHEAAMALQNDFIAKSELGHDDVAMQQAPTARGPARTHGLTCLRHASVPGRARSKVPTARGPRKCAAQHAIYTHASARQ